MCWKIIYMFTASRIKLIGPNGSFARLKRAWKLHKMEQQFDSPKPHDATTFDVFIKTEQMNDIFHFNL